MGDLVVAFGDRRRDPAGTQPCTVRFRRVPLIGQHTVGPGSRSALPFAGHANVVEDRGHHRRVVDVPAGESPAQRSPLTVDDEVDLAGQAAPGASDRVVGRLGARILVIRYSPLLWAAFPEDDVQAWPACARLLSHALVATEHATILEAEWALAADLLNKAAGYLWRRAELEQARQLAERSLTILEAQLGPDHLDVALHLYNLGIVLSDLGELPAARTACERALQIRQAQLGPDHLDVATSLNSLGIILWRLGELPAARTACDRALEIRQAQLGPHHLDVARTLDNLGIVLLALGELPAARTAFQRALTISEAELGPDHPDVASTLDNLGVLLRSLGELPAAGDAHQRALAIRQVQLGPDHPEVARSLDNIGTVLHDLGELPAAHAARQRALTIREAQLGPNHPDVAASLNVSTTSGPSSLS